MSSHAFDTALKLRALDQGRFAGTIGAAYWNMVGPYGGTTAASVLKAILMHPDVLGTPLSITVNYAGALAQGPFEVQLHAARTNRSTQHWTAAIVQNDAQGQPVITTTATAITAVRRETWSLSDVPMPPVARPAEVPPMRVAKAMAWLDNYELRPITGLIPQSWDGRQHDHSLSQLWMRDQPARALDFCSLLALADIFYPRVWLKRASRVPVGTVSMTAYFHAGEPELQATGTGYLLGQVRGQEFRNGFFDHSAQLWNEAGSLLCTSHQIVYYKE